jgi:hypothetical protein
MKTGIARKEIVFQEDEGTQANSCEAIGRGADQFAPKLRALGQALEKFSFTAFDVVIRDGSYQVIGRTTSGGNGKFPLPRRVGNLVYGLFRCPSDTDSAAQVVLQFSPEEIEFFDLRGKSRRRDSNRMPDPYSISQILRGVGFFADYKNVANLVGISLNGNWITTTYQTSALRLEQVQESLQSYYQGWVKMYLGRSNRPKPPPPSAPMIHVTWQGIQKA